MKRLIVFLIILLALPLASAFQIYTQPQEIKFENILINGYTEKTITVFTDSPENIDVSLMASGIFENWITVEPINLKINANNPGKFKIKIQPQTDRLGTYQGMIIINAIYTGNQLTSAITSATNFNFEITLTEKEIIQAKINDIIVNNVELNQPIITKMYLLNNGNKEVNLLFEIDLLDQNQNHLKSISETIAVPPSTDEREATFTFDNDLPVGNYYLTGKVLLNDYLVSQQTAPFKIVEPGNLPQEQQPITQVKEAIPLSTAPTMIVFLFIVLIVAYFGIKRKRESKTKNKKK
ncbi:MAG: hypothetical protein KAT77_05375 [Nanoarchaeota archaeon]|nr:hypothetical protein [Nanoarchaeota archaeon]